MKKTKFVSLLICLVLFLTQAVSAAWAETIKDYTTDSSETGSQINGISITKIADGTAGGGGGIMLERYALSTLELADASYFAIKYYNPNNAAWPIYFICQQNGAFIYMKDGTEYVLTDENFNQTGTGTVQYSALSPAASGVGYVILPASVFPDMSTVEALYFTLPATTGAGIGYHFEKLAYTKAEQPDFSKDLITLTDFSAWTDAWFAGRETNPADTICAIVKKGATVQWKDGLINGFEVKQTAFLNAYNEAGLMVNAFTTENKTSFSLENATYIAIEIANPMTCDMAALIKLQDSDGNQAFTKIGSNVTFFNSDFTNKRESVTGDPYTRPLAGESGWVVIPVSAFEGLGKTIVAVYFLIPTYTDTLNGAAIQFGRIAVYGEENISDYTLGEIVADPYKWDESEYQLRIASTTTEKIVEISKVNYKEKPAELPIAYDLGDVRILEDLDSGYPETEEEYNKILETKIYKLVEGVRLSRYSDENVSGNAMKVEVVEPRADRPDDYAGITFTTKASVNKWTQWVNDDGNVEGVTFFVKNLSECEISMCFEIDEYDPDQDIATNPSGERWSIGLGGRIILYDVITGKESLISATPTFNIPYGFTGWVRIPMNCFVKPAWCTWGNSIMDLQKVPQFTIAINTQQNMGSSFVLDNFGLYYNETCVKSIFANNGNSIKDNMKTGE